MITIPNILTLAAYLLIGPFGFHHDSSAFVPLMLTGTALATAVASKRASRAQSIGLLSVLGIMFYESFVSVTRWLHFELNGFPFPRGIDTGHFVPFLFTFNVGLAVIGAVSAAAVALLLGVRKSRLPLAKLFPETTFVTAPTDVIGSVTALSKTAGIAAPKVFLIDSGGPAAFVTRSGHDYVLALSIGLLESLNHDELDACIAHELSHVKNNDFAIRSFATSARVALFAHPMVHLIEPALYRAREFLADRSAVQLVGERSPLISALTKIRESQEYDSTKSVSIATACLFNPPSGNRLVRLFDKHPSLEDRIKVLKEKNSLE